MWVLSDEMFRFGPFVTLFFALIAVGCSAQGSLSAKTSGVLLLEGAAATTIVIRRSGNELTHDGEILFPTDSARPTGESTYNTLNAYANVLAAYPKVRVRIEGHTDSRGGKGYNRKLSMRRAEAVRTWLIDAREIHPGRLTTKGHGEDRPRVQEPKECWKTKAPKWCESAVWKKNRRSVFYITSGKSTIP